MPTGQINYQSHQTALRIPNDLYTQITDYAGVRGLTLSQALLRLIRNGLGDDNETPVDTPQPPQWRDAVAQLMGRVEALEALVHPGVHDTVHPGTLNGHSEPTGEPDWSFPTFNEAKHYWGKKCAHGHNRQGDDGEEEAMRFVSTRGCCACQAASQRKYRGRPKNAAGMAGEN